MKSLGLHIAGIAAVVVAAVLAAYTIGFVVERLARHSPAAARLSQHARVPFRWLVAAIAAGVGVHVFEPAHGGWPVASHVVALCIIGTGAWLLAGLLFVLVESALPRVPTDTADNRRARTLRTQLMVLRRVTVAAVTVLAIGASLMTFHEVRVVGTSVLASAGLVAAVAAFATNALLSNLVAGLQIAFSGSLRLDDVVVVEEEWGRIEEITLTYVVVHLWDDRRLILPTSYFTTQTFENWTHTESQVLGAVMLEVDWEIDIEGLRGALRTLVQDSPLWDGRVAVAQVVDATGGNVTVRALVSAHDAPTLWDLRCLVREGLVVWIREHSAPPLSRAEVRTDLAEVNHTHRVVPHGDDHAPQPDGQYRREASRGDRMFSGDRESRARGEEFSGPNEDEPAQ